MVGVVVDVLVILVAGVRVGAWVVADEVGGIVVDAQKVVGTWKDQRVFLRSGTNEVLWV